MKRLLILAAAAVLLPSASGLWAEDDATFFTKSVQPILTDRCVSCHGAAKQKGKLRLDSLEAVLKGGKGGAAAVSGKPDESLMIKAIRYQDEDLKMPPKGKKLSDDETKVLVDWVKRGMPWPDSAKIVDGDKKTDEKKDEKKDAPAKDAAGEKAP